jgi:hypothetical protein
MSYRPKSKRREARKRRDRNRSLASLPKNQWLLKVPFNSEYRQYVTRFWGLGGMHHPEIRETEDFIRFGTYNWHHLNYRT